MSDAKYTGAGAKQNRQCSEFNTRYETYMCGKQNK